MKISLKKISSFLIPLIPLLAMYQINFIFNGLSELACVIVFILFFIMGFGKKEENKISNIYIKRNAILLIIFIIASLLNVFNSFNYRTLIYLTIIFFIIFGANRNCIDFKIFKKVYITLSVLCTIYLLLQLLFIKVFNVYLPANILPLETKNLFNAENELNRLGALRLQSFFSEPSLYAQYILPAYFMLLFKNNKKIKEILLLVFFTIGVVLSTSSLGIIAVAISLLFYFYKNSKRNFIKVLIVILVLLPIMFYLIRSNSYIKKSLESIFLNSSSSNKLSVRFFRGFAIYDQMPLDKKIFGAGVGNGEYITSKYNIKTVYETAWHSEGVEYYNNIAASFIYGGILAGVFFGLTQLSFIKSKSNSARILSVIYFIISFASSSFFNVIYLLYGINMICMDNDEKNNGESD